MGAFIGTAIGIGLGMWLGEMSDLPIMLGGFAGLFIGTMTGSLLGVALFRRLPVRFRRYSPSRGRVSVRFTNPDIAARVIEQLRDEARR